MGLAVIVVMLFHAMRPSSSGGVSVVINCCMGSVGREILLRACVSSTGLSTNEASSRVDVSSVVACSVLACGSSPTHGDNTHSVDARLKRSGCGLAMPSNSNEGNRRPLADFTARDDNEGVWVGAGSMAAPTTVSSDIGEDVSKGGLCRLSNS